MSLGKHLVERLKLLGGDGGHREQSVLVEGAGCSYYSAGAWLGHQRAVLEFGDHDRFSVTLRALEVASTQIPDEDLQEFLHTRSAALVRRLSYLEEPLALWELSGAEGVAQLRSHPPQAEGGGLSYWEVVLKIGAQKSARISRYSWQPGQPDRGIIEYPATFSLLGRIASDLAACLE